MLFAYILEISKRLQEYRVMILDFFILTYWVETYNFVYWRHVTDAMSLKQRKLVYLKTKNTRSLNWKNPFFRENFLFCMIWFVLEKQ